MTAGARIFKQLTTLVAFLIVAVGIVLLINFSTRAVAGPALTPTPLPQLANIEVISTKLINISENDYDFLAEVKNPNQSYGSGNAFYELTTSNTLGDVISRLDGQFYIMPGQTKQIIHSPIELSEPATSADLKIKSVQWNKIDNAGSYQVNLIVPSFNYSQPKNSVVFTQVSGTVLNSSDFDLDTVDIIVTILNKDNQIVAANKTSINTFLARTNRGFEVKWTSPFVGTINDIKVEVYTNLFEDSNFIRRFGSFEKFQELY